MASRKLLEIAGITKGRDWTRGYVGYLNGHLPNTDRLLQERGYADVELYELTAQDDRVKACLQQRARALISNKWEVIAANDSRKAKAAKELVEQQIKKLNWDNIAERMLWGNYFGYSVAEVLWSDEGDRTGIAAIKVRNRRRFLFGDDLKPRLRTIAVPLGEELPDRKFWYFSTGADNDDEPYGLGLAYWLYWLVKFKRDGMRWWVLFLELFAQPNRIGKYRAGATQEEKNILWDALDAFGVDGRTMIPEGLDIVLLEASRTGTADYTAIIEQVNSAIATTILGQNMTTEDGSSRSQAEVHQAVALSIVQADSDLLCSSFNNSVVAWLCDYNNVDPENRPMLEYRLEPEVDTASLITRDTALANLGFAPSAEYVAETYGEGFRLMDGADDTLPMLNATQVGALTSMIGQGQGWAPEVLAEALLLSFPAVPIDRMQRLIDALSVGVGAEGGTGDEGFDTGEDEPVAGEVGDELGFSEGLDLESEKWPTLARLINLTYTDRVDRILSAKVVEGDIEALAMDGQKRLKISITPETISIRLAQTAEFAEFRNAPAANPTKRRNCTKGLSCGNTCISKSRTCQKGLVTVQKELYDQLLARSLQPEVKPGFVGEIPTTEISADPKRFQYKLVGQLTKSGEVGSLEGVRTFDPNLAGIVQVWRDPGDDRLYVINGHNRLALAKRAGAEAVAVRVIDAPDAATARGIGALTNIAEGRGTALDAAKFFRDTGLTAQQIQAKGIPLRERIATDGLAISKLDDGIFQKVVNGSLSESRASILGAADLTPAQQRDMVEIADGRSKKGKISDETFRELIEGVKAAAGPSQGGLFDLFGNQEQKSSAIERASLAAGIRKQLGQDKRLFKLVAQSKVADKLNTAGNKIDKAVNAEVGDTAERAMNAFDQLKNMSGPISKTLSDFAQQVADGKLSPADAQKAAYEAIAESIKSGNF